jgi:hypothetical protein
MQEPFIESEIKYQTERLTDGGVYPVVRVQDWYEFHAWLKGLGVNYNLMRQCDYALELKLSILN